MKTVLIEFMEANRTTYARWMIKNQPLYQWVNTFPGETMGEKTYNALNDITETPKCKAEACNKKVKFKDPTNGYASFCCSKCAQNDPSTFLKKKGTMIERYGVEHNHQSKELMDRMKQRNIEKYGVENPMQTKVVQDKVKKTTLEKYGVENAFSSVEIKQKIKETNLERYGVYHPLQNEDILGKVKTTNLERYGVESTLSHEDTKEKIVQTNIEKYGVKNPFASDEIKQKIKETNIEKYGVEYPLQNKDVHDKVSITVLLKYGVTNVFQNEGIKQKIKETLNSRYGVEYVYDIPNIYEKIKQTNIEKYGVGHIFSNETPAIVNEALQAIRDRKATTIFTRYGVVHPMQSKEVSERTSKGMKENFVNNGGYNGMLTRLMDEFQVEPLFSKVDYIESKPLRWKHVCGTEYESKVLDSGRVLVCPNPECRIQSTPQRSVYEFVKGLIGGEHILVNDRTVLKPYELDIYIPSKKVAIEMDGIFWHQMERDINKYKVCKEQGIELLHITDISWKYNREKWEGIIKNELGCGDFIIIEECKIQDISLDTIEKFMNEYSLQGYTECEKGYGVFYDSSLIMVMGLKANYVNNHCIKGGIKLEYGYQVLLTYISNNKIASKIEIGQHLGYGGIDIDGVMLERFESKGYYFVHSNGTVCQKTNVKELCGDKYNCNLSEQQNMRSLGYYLVNDRGVNVYSFGENK